MKSLKFMWYRLYRAWIPLQRIICAIVPGTREPGIVYRVGKRRPYFRQDQRIIIDPVRHQTKAKSGTSKKKGFLVAWRSKKKRH